MPTTAVPKGTDDPPESRSGRPLGNAPRRRAREASRRESSQSERSGPPRSGCVSLRIELVDPPAGHAFCLQRGKGSKSERLNYVEVLEGDDDTIAFDLEVIVRRARTGPEPDFIGPFVQGPPGARFFYLCVGQCVEGGAPRWSGRVKVPLTGIDWASVESASDNQTGLCARYAASRPDGRPVFAAVPLLGDGWAPTID